MSDVPWREVEARLKERLQTLRERNDGNLSLEETARLRGQIAEIKDLLKLPEDIIFEPTKQVKY